MINSHVMQIFVVIQTLLHELLQYNTDTSLYHYKNKLNFSGITPIMAAAERTRANVVEYLITKCRLSIDDQIKTYELLGASFANDKENYCLNKTYHYLIKGMKLR